MFDSVKAVPETDFSLSDCQTGAYCESLKWLLCVGFMVNDSNGIPAFDVEKCKWRENWICPLFQFNPVTHTALTVHLAIAQPVECDGSVYLFSEQETGRNVTHSVDRLDNRDGHCWTRVVTQQREETRALLVYPEDTCVQWEENQLCMFNTIERTGVVYDLLKDPLVPLNFCLCLQIMMME